ncbi:hypothetical protein QTN25_004718 [Entamoeba marina]
MSRLEPFYLINVLLYCDTKSALEFNQINKSCKTATEMLHTNPWNKPKKNAIEDIERLMKIFPNINTLRIDTMTLTTLPITVIDKVQRIQLVGRTILVKGKYSPKLVFSNSLLLLNEKYKELHKLCISNSQLNLFFDNISKYPSLKYLRIQHCSNLSLFVNKIKQLVQRGVVVAVGSSSKDVVIQNRQLLGDSIFHYLEVKNKIWVIKNDLIPTEEQYEQLSLENEQTPIQQSVYKKTINDIFVSDIEKLRSIIISPYKFWVSNEPIVLFDSLPMHSYEEIKTEIIKILAPRIVVVIIDSEKNVFGFVLNQAFYGYDKKEKFSYHVSRAFSSVRKEIFNPKQWKKKSSSDCRGNFEENGYLFTIREKNLGLLIRKIGVATNTMTKLETFFHDMQNDALGIDCDGFCVERILILRL